MKSFTLAASALLIFSCSASLASSGSSVEITAEMKSKAIESIGEYVFFEDEGAMRLPKGVEDFSFVLKHENMLHVTGSSYSDWDMKVIGYDCEVAVPSYEVKRCTLEGENWPYL